MPKDPVLSLITLINEYDPGLENFLGAVACLMDQTSTDTDKQLSAKQIAANVAKLPLVAMKSKIMFAYMTDWEASLADTVEFLEDAEKVKSGEETVLDIITETPLEKFNKGRQPEVGIPTLSDIIP